MLRRALLGVSTSDRLRGLAERNRASRAVAGRFVAGDDLDAAVAAVRELNASGAAVTLDLLGEEVTDPEKARAAADGYVAAIRRIVDEGLDCSVSLKPSQLGLGLGPSLCASLVGRICEEADRTGMHVTLDMEGSDTTPAIVELTAQLAEAGHDVGCAVQAYLHRTPRDVARLTALGSSLRVCKGAYAEPAAIALQGRGEIRQAYLALAEQVLRGGTYGRFATHDEWLIDQIANLAARYGVDRERYEIQMLYGVREPLQRTVLARGLRLRVYVPFGTEWYPYFLRRLAERPANLTFFLRALVGRR